MGQRSRQKLVQRIVKGKVSTIPCDVPWTPFERAVDSNGNDQCFDGTDTFDIYRNSRYTVMRRVVKSSYEGEPDLVHLSIKRNDRAPIMNWRDLQKIKNDLIGPECEGVQIFPAESRLVDTSNQYHLFVCSKPGHWVPFGYSERLVCEGNNYGAIQEPFEGHVKPTDLVSEETMNDAYESFKRGSG